jgi:lysophospholipase L1-like esterase
VTYVLCEAFGEDVSALAEKRIFYDGRGRGTQMKQHSELYDAAPGNVYAAALATLSNLGYSVDSVASNEVINATTKRRVLNPRSVQRLQLLVIPQAQQTKLTLMVGTPDQRVKDVSLGDLAARRRAVRDVFAGVSAELAPLP